MATEYINTAQSAALLEQALGRIRTDVVLGPFTTFQIGGPADLFFEAQTADELAAAIQSAREHGIPYFLLGRGANILIGDGGFRGLVVRSAARHMKVDVENARLWVESGAIMYPDVIHTAVNCGLSGLEHYV
ncbi:MAG: FAD-binding protein, partial [Rhodothermales bacterium]